MATEAPTHHTNFIKQIIEEDLARGEYKAIKTRFPPEPNGYLHVGHAKSICLNFGLANEYKGSCNLRLDDTNPLKEDEEYENAIVEDIKWLGFSWDQKFHASDYYESFYNFAVTLIKQGHAYVCPLNADEIRSYRGDLTNPGKESPGRNRSITENLDLFSRMRAGEFVDGQYTLRGKIDMAHPNIVMRDPTFYRIRHTNHHRTGSSWCIYPMYDFAHCISDALEGITHSICTLEFQNNRPLYDWILEKLEFKNPPHQHEFSRLNLNYTIMSKRSLKRLVDENIVNGWDDPRMPTICGLRRRGYTPRSLRNFAERIGVSKKDTIIDMSILEETVRDDLNKSSPRALCVIDPLKVVIENFDSSESLELSAPNHQEQPEMGRRTLNFSREIYIEHDDFSENPPKGFHRLSLGGEVRLRYGFVIKCTGVVKDPSGHVIELKAQYYPETLGGKPLSDGRKVKGIIHWVDARSAREVEVRLYDRLFKVENPAADKDKDFTEFLNQDSLKVLPKARLEPHVEVSSTNAQAFQFERLGYFAVDPESKDNALIFNRVVTLKDTWSKTS